MSQRKLPWSGPEKKLLLEIWSEKPHGQLSEITRDFNARNDQVQPKTITDENNRYRTEEAIKMQLKGMRKESKQSNQGVATTTQAPPSPTTALITSLRAYTWVEMGLSVPRHPLIAEARMYANKIQDMAGSLDSIPMPQWPAELTSMDVSGLPCADKDRGVVKEYLRYLSNAESNFWRI